MADSKISGLTELTTRDGDMEFAINDASTSKKVTADTLLTYTGPSFYYTSTGSRYNHAAGGQANGTFTPSNERAYFSRFYIPIPLTINRMTANVTTAAAGALIRLGIYTCDADGFPESLVLDAGTADASTTGIKDITVSQALNVGWYFYVYVGQSTGASATVTRFLSDADPYKLIAPITSTITTFAPPYGYYQTGVSGALPSTTSLTGVDGLTTAPFVSSRIV